MASIDRILKAAEAEFAEAGYDNAKMERIAARAKISKQLVYHYFGGKPELYRDMLHVLARNNHEVFLSIDYESLPPVQAIRAYIEVFFDQYYERPINAVVTIDQNLHSGAHVKWRPDTSSMYQQVVQKLRDVLERGKRQGDFTDNIEAEDLHYMAIVIVSGSVMSRSMFQEMGGGTVVRQGERDYWKNFATSFIIRALRP